MKASQIDKKFDENSEDILEYFDTENIRKVNEAPKRVNIDFPTWMVESLDREAQHIGVSRQAIIKMWLAEKLSRVEKVSQI
ncbi:CopG family transcriptional regulator [Halarcobacter ebronensis]|uniref:CopG family transcriptional regulator n=1 Tax=Halarcobacter ebronensis TaxID=1462615 RepID=A0A4Q0YAE3_9BACT|nr:CopG family transcriptional regulator [Halarcobacter ebronensis]RXJ66983.1 CopG family transcriptional regulator [Halarcobacter ebronensis]